MSVHNVLNDIKFVTMSLADMVTDEKKRIIAAGLASVGDVNGVLGGISDNILKIAQADRKWEPVLDSLSKLHGVLSAVRLPGDFERLASDPIILDLSNLPRLEDKEYEDKFYDLSGIIERLKKIHESEGCESHTDVEVNEEPHEDFNSDVKIARVILVEKVSTHLEKIAYQLGRDGNHEAAYLVERTIREMQS